MYQLFTAVTTWLTGSWGSMPAAQNHERASYHISLVQEKVKIQSLISSWSWKICSQTITSRGLSVIISTNQGYCVEWSNVKPYKDRSSRWPWTHSCLSCLWGLPSLRSRPWDEDSRIHKSTQGVTLGHPHWGWRPETGREGFLQWMPTSRWQSGHLRVSPPVDLRETT